MTKNKIFEGNRVMNVMVWGSGGITSGRFLIENQEKYNYKVAALMTNKITSKVFNYEGNIPVVYTNLPDFKLKWGWDTNKFQKGTPEFEEYKKKMRTDFDLYNASRIQNEIIDNSMGIDIVFMSGWMLKVYQPLLDVFYGRILNVHPAKLDILLENGKPKYTGDDAVYDAIKAGERFTYSSIHIATENPDEGPVIVISKPLEVKIFEELQNYPDAFPKELRKFSKDEIIRMYVDGDNEFWEKGHQEIQKYECDNPAALKAIELASLGKLETDFINNKLVLVNDVYRIKS